MWDLKTITPASAPALDLATEVKEQLRLDGAELAAQTSILTAYIATATSACEKFTRRQLITATLELWLDTWYEPGIFRCENGLERQRMPRAPLGTITSIKYRDGNGVEQAWASDQYVWDVASGGDNTQRAEVLPVYGITWPTLRQMARAVKIQFTAGYGAAFSTVPAPLRAGMLLLVAEMYERREETIIGIIQSTNAQTAEKLWWPFRAW